ncbi:MAG: hypothetical protein NTV50_07130 [Planctomycetota bacterium]|nr:hypothetical protein [Planctomycetota bacterium]
MRLLLVSFCLILLVPLFGCGKTNSDVKKSSDDAKINFIKTFQKYENNALGYWVIKRVEDIEDGGMSWGDADKEFFLGGFTMETQNAYRKWRTLRTKVKNASE